MALQLDGFATPEKSYSQLYNLGEANERRQYRQSQLDEQRRAKRAANASMLTNLLDPKEHLSGSLYDPEISKSLQDMLAEGAKLADEGADGNMILMALGPKVAKVSEYAQKAKLLKKQDLEFAEQVKPIIGIDRAKAIEAFREKAFFTIDPKTGEKVMKDIGEIDPNKMYGDEVLRDGDVFTNESISDFVKTAGKETREGDYKYYNKLGSLTQTKGKYTAPPFMIPEKDARGAHIGFVPDFELPTEGGIPQELDFHEENGVVTAPIRMVTDAVFDSLKPAAKGFLRQEARRYAKEHGVELASPQAYNFAKALAYDEIKKSSKNSSFFSETPEYTKPSAIQIKIDNGIPIYKPSTSGGSGDGSVINDIHGRIWDKVSGNFANGKRGTRFNSLANDEQEVVKKAVDNAGFDLEEGGRNIFLIQDGDRMKIYKTDEQGRPSVTKQNEIAELPFIGTNIGKQANVKGKVETVKKGNQQPAPKPASGIKWK